MDLLILSQILGLAGVAATTYWLWSRRNKRVPTRGQPQQERFTDNKPPKAKKVFKSEDQTTRRSRQPFEILYSGTADNANEDPDIE